VQPRTLQRAASGLVVLAVILGSFAARVVTSAASELEAADALRARGELPAAVVHYRRAARWYAPASPYHVRALQRLGELGAAAEQDGELELALSAYRGIRAAILSTRSFYTPERARLQAANRRIADLMAAEPPPEMDAGKSRAALAAEHLKLLEADPGPSLLWTLVLLLGFGAWVGGALAFSLRAIDENDRLVRPQAMRWGALVALGLGLFVAGLLMA